MLNADFRRRASKFLEEAEKEFAQRLVAAIQDLQTSPFPSGVKRVENQWFEGEKVFRIRVGDYRVLYTVNHQKNRILVVTIDKRPRAY